MEIQLHGRLITCTPEEYKRLIDLNLIEVPTHQSANCVVPNGGKVPDFGKEAQR